MASWSQTGCKFSLLGDKRTVVYGDEEEGKESHVSVCKRRFSCTEYLLYSLYLRILLELYFLKMRGSMYTMLEYNWTWNGWKKKKPTHDSIIFSIRKYLAIKLCPEKKLSEDYFKFKEYLYLCIYYMCLWVHPHTHLQKTD